MMDIENNSLKEGQFGEWLRALDHGGSPINSKGKGSSGDPIQSLSNTREDNFPISHAERSKQSQASAINQGEKNNQRPGSAKLCSSTEGINQEEISGDPNLHILKMVDGNLVHTRGKEQSEIQPEQLMEEIEWVELDVEVRKEMRRNMNISWKMLIIAKWRWSHVKLLKVLSCVSSNSFSFNVNVNVKVVGYVTPSRGIGRGTLSPLVHISF